MLKNPEPPTKNTQIRTRPVNYLDVSAFRTALQFGNYKLYCLEKTNHKGERKIADGRLQKKQEHGRSGLIQVDI